MSDLKAAERYAKVKNEGPDKSGRIRYSSHDFHYLQTCRPKIEAFLAGIEYERRRAARVAKAEGDE